MASDRSVIPTAEPGSEMDWIIKAAQAGRVVAPEDPEAFTQAIRLAYLEREKLQLEGEQGRRFVERDYSKEAIARKYHSLICSLVNRGL